MTTKLSKQFIEKVRAVTAKRPKTVIDHILAHGQVTTDELKALMADASALMCLTKRVGRIIPNARDERRYQTSSKRN